ncbi:putative transcription factor TDA9 [Podospora aff. communis PSN243]|uniref:Transcription factor TDA9 n=1 Tax=Podospora aff. communis PSN243 TaxID=3040156 RepID=A0AAV9GMN2_9PEZI|nr:putative transcription factor TDA9 [Podospora aff. communis PSN243]
MASLKFIMDVNDDHQPDTRHTNKKDATPANAGQLQLQLLEEGTNTPPHPGHVSSSSGLVVEHQNHINPAVPNPQTTTNINKRRAVSTRGPKSTTTALPAPLSSSTSSSAAIPSISSELSPLSTSVSTSRPPARRRSTASVDSMDQTGYGSAASSSSMGHGLHHPNQPMRPMPPHPQGNEIPMRLTPITGRVSRAKKGVPVHVCDLCKPAKTFTRAEHLRRHQLSHQNPGYACTYPGCERAFHRPDLLARHQQRHDVEGDKASKSGGHEGDRGVSSARSSMDDGYRGGQLQQSASGSSSAISGSGAGSMASSSATGISSTPNASENQRRYSEMSSSTATGSPATPRAMGGGGASAYRSSGSASRHGDYNSYPMPSSTVSIIDPTHSSSISGGYPGVMDYQTPRSASQSMNIMSTLPTLLIPEHNKTPELSYAHDGASPWTSSASDSTYSTPASDIPRRAWMRPRSPAADWPTNTHQLLSPYPGTAPRNLQNPGGGLDTMPSMYANSNQYSTSSYTHAPAHQQQSYYDVSMNPYGSAAGPGQHGTYRSHHQHSTSISSIPSPIQASNTSSSHIGEALIAPAAHPGRLDPLLGLGRQKELAMATHPSLMDSQTMGGLGVLDGMYGSLDGGRSTGDNEGAILTALDMPIGGGCSMAGPGMGHPLQRSVRESIPGYLSTYWDKVHPVLPVVHRQSFEAGPDDALRCAMAAVATQYLNSKEDRTRGNQLHEFAWHEAKRVTSWNMQTMQAILLLEYFARFRGRKAVTKPSKLFESLYSRVSALQFFTASSSLPFGSRDPDMPWLVDTSVWSPASSPPSDCSSCASVTPTAAAVGLSYTQVQVPPAHTLPTNTSLAWDSFPSSYASSTSSAFNGGIPSSPLSFHPEDPFPQHTITTPATFNVNIASPITTNTTTTTGVTGAQRSYRWSSLFSPGRYNPPLMASLSFRTRSSHVAEHTYSQALYTLQVLYQNPAMFNNTDADSHLPTEERWRTWLDMEARRRLLAGCFHLDGHAATYQQQLRAHDFDADGMTPIPPVPLFSRSADLWNASSADEWAAILDAFPDKGIPLFAPSSEQLTPEMVMSQTPYDRMAILGIEMLRLPRRQPVAASSSAHSSPLPDEAQLPTDPQLQNYGSQQPTSCAPEPLGLDVEDHISKLFAKCPIGNTYLALHHTPLQDLLAVGGDSWVFSQKVLPATSFLEHQKRLKLWTEQHSRPSAPFSANNNNNSGIANLSAIRATVYAARAILLFLERGPGSSWSTDLSDYWALYVCALIIWAFGHRARPVPTSDARHHGHHQRNSSGGSISSAPASRLSSAAAVAVAADEEAIGWLRTVAAEGVRLEDVVRLRARREAAGVVGLVMRRLEADCVGGRSRLYVDAVGVLRKLDVEVIRKWF